MCRRKVGVVPSKKLGTKKIYTCSVFRQFRDLVPNSLWTKHDIDNRARTPERRRGPLNRPKISWTLVHKRLQIKFLPALRKFCSLLHCQASHTEVSKRNSTKLCDMTRSEPYFQMHQGSITNTNITTRNLTCRMSSQTWPIGGMDVQSCGQKYTE